MQFLETSARTSENVEAAFTRMAEQLIKNKQLKEAPAPNPNENVDMNKRKEDGKKGCC